jgi:polysaccharide biosynthesis transport protein
MAEDEENWRILLARQFAVGVDENNRVMLKFDLPMLAKPRTQALPAPAADAPPAGPRVIKRDDGLFWHVIDSPFSRFTESIRTIKIAADLEFGTKSTKVIGFTSAQPNEGKSTVAAAFAHLAAQTGARTILVDCDLRNPSLSRTLTRTSKAGIQDVIAGNLPLEELLWTDPVTGLAFLPAATRSRVAHTSEILASDAAKALFQKLRASYEYVVVDLSPLAPVVDVRTTTNFVDSFFFVIEWGRTKIDVVDHVLHDAPGVFERISGVVLNKADVDMLSRYGYHGYYKNKYYNRYGYTD